ncbi:MAG: DUF5011 domain-containing protein [Gammaproteobacteria bacterium]|nr:DUF5011 domain-containing protein [Gammaproteobacteria bacterium]
MFKRAIASATMLAVITVFPTTVPAQSMVEQNSNVVGRTAPGYYRGIPGMQDNEGSCAINPILPRNIVCAWNASGGSDDAIGDTWLRFSESLDSGRSFFNRYLNGSNLDPVTSIGQQFAADPVMMCWPGGCGTVMLASSRAENGGQGGGIYIQWMADLNTESGFRKAFKINLDQVYRSTGSKFADKPHAIYMLDEDNPGTVDVAFDVELPDGTGGFRTERIVRSWPRARILVVFALFNPSKNDIEILTTFTDDYGTNWSNPRQIAQTSGRDQGVSVAAIGNTVFFGFRRFATSGDTDDIMGVVSTDRGDRTGKPFVVAQDVCVYDVPTLPSTANSTAAAARTNDFPWVSEDGSRFIMVYSERRRSSDGGCLTIPGEPSDSRIVASIGSANGKNWSTPVEVAPNADHGFQFMPVVDCSLGVCQIAWWDSRRDSARVRDFMNAQGGPVANAALAAFEGVPILADFNFPVGGGSNEVIQFRRTADMYTKKVTITNGQLSAPDEPSLASRYRLGLYDNALVELEANPFNVKAYRTNSVPFMSDYSSMSSAKHRLVFDPSQPQQAPFWESNSGPNALDPDAEPSFWLAWTDARNMRGQLYTAAIDGQPPFARTPEPPTIAATNENASPDEPVADPAATLTAEALEDFNPAAGSCTPISAANAPPAGTYFPALNNRVKDSDIYGALVESRVTAWSLNPTKTLGSIQRVYTIIAENESLAARQFRFEIANQPTGDPATSRASWKQLPWDPSGGAFLAVAPTTSVVETAGPQSSVTVALFVVSELPINPVNVQVFDESSNALVSSITVNGTLESGPLLSPNGTINVAEIHNPELLAPDQFNPDQYNPDQYNPDQFNPDLFNPDQFNPDQFNPDQFNPDQFNPDQFNPDQFNPDQFNPDQFNPDQFNPDQFNPDQFNPDQFNTNLTDADDLHNPEIPQPNLVGVPRDTGDTVVKLDVNFGLKNVGNTATPYTLDFAIADSNILALIENREIATQIIAWQNKQVDDVTLCVPRLVTENRVIAAVNDPDLSELVIPTIDNNRTPTLTYFVTPGDILQITLRFIGKRENLQTVAAALENDIISYVFASQAANTGENDLGINREQVVNDRTPATFNFQNGAQVLEANAPGGASLPADYVTATKDDAAVDVTCLPTLPTVIPLNILNGGTATDLSCWATTDNGVTAGLDLAVSVFDTEAPVIDPTSVPQVSPVEAISPSGAIVTFANPTASDIWGVDGDVDVICAPPSGDEFPFSAPGPTTTTVSCIATDDSGNVSEPETFDVVVEDTQAPTIGDVIGYDPTPPPVVLGADQSSFLLTWDFAVNDADASPAVECTPGTAVSAVPPLYVFNHDFPVGVTPVSCTATDSNGQFASISFSVEIVDVTPPVITLNGDDTVTLDAGSGPYQDAGATAIDNGDPDVNVTIEVDADAVDTNTPGTYTVTITATDPSGNTSTATRTVLVEFSYGLTGIIPAKTNVRMGSSNPLRWAWLDADGNPADSSGDMQFLRIEDCVTGALIINPAGDPGTSGFRFKADNWWQYNWDSMAPAGAEYCAYVVSGRTGQEMQSPNIGVR